MDLRIAYDMDAVPLAYRLSVLDDLTMPGDAMTEDDWKTVLSRQRCAVVYSDDFQMAAVVVWAAGIAYLYSNAVSGELRGQGWGKKLVYARVVIAREEGCVAIQAHTRTGNTVAQNMLKRCGFLATKYVPDFYDDFEDAILWEMIL